MFYLRNRHVLAHNAHTLRGTQSIPLYASYREEVEHFLICSEGTKTLNLLNPNDIYICRTAALTSRRYILNIYSTNIRTEYFKHAA